jgi:hypothetical protein
VNASRNNVSRYAGAPFTRLFIAAITLLCFLFVFIICENIFACAVYLIFGINSLTPDVHVKNSVPASQQRLHYKDNSVDAG